MIRLVTSLPVIEKTVADGNWDTTRNAIDRVVIHTMVGTASSANTRFNNPTQKVSAHYGVLLNGQIWHWVDEDNTAYHAGDYAMNQRSIGIEHEDNGDYNGLRTDALYTASAKLVRDICQFYNIPIDRQHIIKHSEVIATGCPDALDIERIIREAANTAPIATITQAELDKVRLERDKNWNLYQNDEEIIKKLNSLINERNTTIAQLQNEVSTLKESVANNLERINSLTDQAKRIPDLEKRLAQAEGDRTICLSAQETQNRRIAQLENSSYKTMSTGTLINELLIRFTNKLTGGKV